MAGQTVQPKNALYEKFRIPVPESLKWASTRGGYTTIMAQYQMEKCTEIWGPYGIAWGLDELEWTWIFDKETPVYVQLDCYFFWAKTKYSEAGRFEMTTGWAFSSGDSDVLKKAQTDAISKSLSKLGIDSDVFKGLWAGKGADKVVTYVGPNPTRDVPQAEQDRIVLLEDVLFPQLPKDIAKKFTVKLDKVKWNYLAVEAIIAKVEKHLKVKVVDA